MKNFKLVLVMAFVAVSNIVMANVDPKPSNKEVSKQLSTILGTPTFKVTENDMVAKVHFMVNKRSEIVVINVSAENDMVEEYIKSRMNYKKVEVAALKPNEEYIVDVRIVAKG
ncbi:hypothetical protein [Galbibacter orientalis]|uniref:Uncharacterized protein n=1 Tax=Galbibacter orientalis DSM 19592 TaxID=926559 RepID=I3CAZ9_9FLAO|nr:hypothetical protein [Galbibacter orientalis]EIJ40792.1 hypothetical protein JoomaDRAFT_3863 [Galbibacter orientalis DSM 19592]